MAKRKRKMKRASPLQSKRAMFEETQRAGESLGASDYISGPKLRAKLSISAVTLWRWRHNDSSGFPAAKSINGRLYFPWADVQAWLDRQPVAA